MLWSVLRLIFKLSSVTPDFFYVFNLILSFSTCSQSFKKISTWEVLGANVVKWCHSVLLEIGKEKTCNWFGILCMVSKIHFLQAIVLFTIFNAVILEFGAYMNLAQNNMAQERSQPRVVFNRIIGSHLDLRQNEVAKTWTGCWVLFKIVEMMFTFWASVETSFVKKTCTLVRLKLWRVV